ncbi:MAG: D-aminoacylase [Pirellulales bacterium]|nr:D-aminoacylase [Pirellulales bacterium]
MPRHTICWSLLCLVSSILCGGCSAKSPPPVRAERREPTPSMPELVDAENSPAAHDESVTREPERDEIEEHDVVIRNALVYDGSGGKPIDGGVAIDGDRIVHVGDVSHRKGKTDLDARGKAVAPGFINMLSWATTSLIEDPLSQSDIRQGVTLEVMGEGWSMGPLTDEMRRQELETQSDIKYEIPWTTLGEYLEYLEDRGVSPNVASFVGATTVRIHVLGYEDRPPTEEELREMQDLVRQAMQEGALGVGSSLIYAPAFYASTEELIALCQVAGEHGGMYISHIRSEGNQLLEAVDELIRIAREANVPAEIYHLKAAGEKNWPKFDEAFHRIEQARSEGLDITANMYTYTAGATGLNAAMPPWVQEGGLDAWVERLQDPETRLRLLSEMRVESDRWENLLLLAGSPANVLLVGFSNEKLKPLTGKTLAQVAAERGKSPEETAMDLVVEDHSRVDTVYFMMSEDNVRRGLAQPWVSLGSDAGSETPAGKFLLSQPHPRAYGNFARFLGKYVREEQVVPLEEAIHKLTALPAENLKLKDRGRLAPGYFADVVLFDPATIADQATFEVPHQYSTGVDTVLVNGVPVLRDGEHTGAKPGKFVRGPGWRENQEDHSDGVSARSAAP